MTRFLKVAEGVDVKPLLAEIDANADLWGQFGWRKNIPGGPHSGMTDIWVRYNDIRPFEACGDFAGFNSEHESVWYPAYYRLPALKGIIFPLMTLVEGERLGGVLITRIPPCAGIGAHRDAGWHVNHYDKFYVSLKSAPGAHFHSGDELICPVPGDVYRFDNRLEHWVENRSTEDRVTLIVCIRTRKYDDRDHVSVTDQRRAA
jgi:hypothetical protein